MPGGVSVPPRSILAQIFLSPDIGRLRAGWRLLLHGGLALILSLLISLAVLLPLLILTAIQAVLQESFGLELDLLGDLLQPGPISGQLLALSAIVSFPSLTLATWLARRLFDRRSFRSLGFEPGGFAWRDLLVGFWLPGLLFGLIFGAEWALGWIRIEGWLWDSRPVLGVVALVGGSLAVFALVGFYEELTFRGYYLHNIRDGLGLAPAVLLSSLVFALAHAGNPFASWTSTAGLIAAGLFLAYAWVRTRRLWLPIGLHLGWNFFQGTVFGFPVSGTTAPGLLVQRAEGPPLLTGGGFGPEAGLIVLPAMLLGAWLIRLYTAGRALPPSEPAAVA
jgi:membrane protease YdiL (CAAX protease family)